MPSGFFFKEYVDFFLLNTCCWRWPDVDRGAAAVSWAPVSWEELQVFLVQSEPSSDHCYDTHTTLVSQKILNWWPLEASPFNKLANSTLEALFLIERTLCHPVVDSGKYMQACKYTEAMSLKIFWLSLCCQPFFTQLNQSQICPSVHRLLSDQK